MPTMYGDYSVKNRNYKKMYKNYKYFLVVECSINFKIKL